MNHKPIISIIVCTYNDEKYIKKCISSILVQTQPNFELIIFDDGSIDKTKNIVKSFKDDRIKYHKLKKNTGSLGKIRKKAINLARGKFIFMTDSDCYAKKNWLDQGLKMFNDNKYLVLEGKVIYHKIGYKPTLSDLTVRNENGGEWMTANMAYSKKILKQYEFNPKYKRMEDREMALRIQEKYRIPFVKSMVVYHQKKTKVIKKYIQSANSIKYKVMLIKNLNDKIGNKLKILNPKMLLVAIFPPLVLAEFIEGRIKSWNDLKLLPFVWIKAIYMRFIIWKVAIEERIFII